jgi:Phage integrase, N-terminal SAM-like domain
MSCTFSETRGHVTPKAGGSGLPAGKPVRKTGRLMAWVDQRSMRTPHWRVVSRDAGGRQYEKFPTAEQAECCRQLVFANGERRVALPLPGPVAAAPVQPVAADIVTFAEWARFWIDTYSGPRETTLVRYRSVIERDLIPVFGAMDIAAINKQHDSGWIRQLQAAGAAPKTIRNNHSVLYGDPAGRGRLRTRAAAGPSPPSCPRSSSPSSATSLRPSSPGSRRP